LAIIGIDLLFRVVIALVFGESQCENVLVPIPRWLLYFMMFSFPLLYCCIP
jgi:hypothetical protein